MRLNLKYFIAVNVILCLVGIISVLIGILGKDGTASPIWDAVGTGLLAAGAVNILDRSLTLEAPGAPKERIEVVSEKRVMIPGPIIDLKYNARKVDLIGVSLNHFLKELVNDPRQSLITRLLRHNLQLRLFFVHPASKYLEQRAFEDNLDLARLIEGQQEAVRLCTEFYRQLKGEYDRLLKNGELDEHLVGSLQIILLDCCPYTTIYRVDEEIYWGLYTSATSGVNLPLFKTSMSQDPTLFRQMHEHIHAFMGHEDKYPKLVHMPEMKKPVLNKRVLQSALK